MHFIQPFKNAEFRLNYMPKKRIFWKKAVKSPQRRGLRPRTPIGLRRLWDLLPDTLFVFKTKDFNIPHALIFVSN